MFRAFLIVKEHLERFAARAKRLQETEMRCASVSWGKREQKRQRKYISAGVTVLGLSSS
jgi:hypothetical protein